MTVMQSCTVTCVHADTAVAAGTYPPGSGYGYGPAAPTLASLNPTNVASGAGTTTVTLTGTGFAYGMYVTARLGATVLTLTPTIASATSATIAFPRTVALGAWQIRAENIAGASVPRTFTLT
jgi:hypothetical protein